jgi:hypothetical protein
LTEVSEVLTAAVIRANRPTLRCIPEDSHLHTRRRENLKSHLVSLGRKIFTCHKKIRLVHNEERQMTRRRLGDEHLEGCLRIATDILNLVLKEQAKAVSNISLMTDFVKENYYEPVSKGS